MPVPGGRVAIDLYNVRGQLVKSLVAGLATPGRHTVSWDGTDFGGGPVATGVYFVAMEAMGFRGTRKLVLLK